MTAPVSHEAYLADLPPDRRAALEDLRKTILETAPNAEECIAFGIPAYRVGPGTGGVLTGYASMKKHCGLYFFDETLVARFADRLSDFSISTGTIRFTPDHPMPPELVRDMIAARLDDLGLTPRS